MDNIDTAVVYAMFGGLLCGATNWAVRGAPDMQVKGNFKYYALFASMGCLAGTLVYLALPDILTPSSTGIVGGFFGSYFLLGVGNYM
jgi:hypothetical protein